MATLNLYGDIECFGWYISGLGKEFSSENGYVEAGITRYQFTQSTSSISGIVDSITAPDTNDINETDLQYVSYSPGTYTFWGYTLAKNGTYYPAGKATVTVDSDAPARPDDWAWWSVIQTGAEVKISAYEWENFCNRINEFRLYCGLPEYGAFVDVTPGVTEISYDVVKHAVWAINAMNPPIKATATSSGSPIYASFFNRLRDALNSID